MPPHMTARVTVPPTPPASISVKSLDGLVRGATIAAHTNGDIDPDCTDPSKRVCYAINHDGVRAIPAGS